jgi:hypothetical protein
MFLAGAWKHGAQRSQNLEDVASPCHRFSHVFS